MGKVKEITFDFIVYCVAIWGFRYEVFAVTDTLETPKIVPGLEMHVVRPSREELENVWRERLNEALRQYRIAKFDASTALIQYRQGEMPTPDGNFAFRKAAEAENRAFCGIYAPVVYLQ